MAARRKETFVKRVIIIGGGYAGTMLARSLDPVAEVVLSNRRLRSSITSPPFGRLSIRLCWTGSSFLTIGFCSGDGSCTIGRSRSKRAPFGWRRTGPSPGTSSSSRPGRATHIPSRPRATSQRSDQRRSAGMRSCARRAAWRSWARARWEPNWRAKSQRECPRRRSR